jgi:CubicO group peptidase (beta-lactamase class C family)
LGEAMIYNNSAYLLLGHIIEKASGMSYERYVQEKIFAPLGMHDSSYCDNHAIIPNRASGYQIQGPNMRRALLNDHTWPFSAGSLCSTAGDLVAWLYALHGGRALSARQTVQQERFTLVDVDRRPLHDLQLRVRPHNAVGAEALG